MKLLNEKDKAQHMTISNQTEVDLKHFLQFSIQKTFFHLVYIFNS